jgi:hypothetical protein
VLTQFISMFLAYVKVGVKPPTEVSPWILSVYGLRPFCVMKPLEPLEPLPLSIEGKNAKRGINVVEASE